MKIGNLKIKYPIFLAPMAGVTDHPFRLICKEMGAGVVYTEFVSANGIIRKNLKTLELMKFSNEERPIGIQIFGDDPKIVGESANIVNEMFQPDLIDINYGCPVPKITKKGAGSAALKDLCLMEEITHAVIEAVTDIPITVKMRAGWDNNNIVSTDAGKRLEKIGVSAITLHPRTTKQLFTGLSKWHFIKELKSEVSIPVIGNGDILFPADYFKMKNETNCDGVMIGRAALGNPWIFKSILNKINGDEILDTTLEEKIDMCKKHFLLLKEDKNEQQCINLAKKHFSYYLKGFNNASKWRKDIMLSNSYSDIIEKIDFMENEIQNMII